VGAWNCLIDAVLKIFDFEDCFSLWLTLDRQRSMICQYNKHFLSDNEHRSCASQSVQRMTNFDLQLKMNPSMKSLHYPDKFQSRGLVDHIARPERYQGLINQTMPVGLIILEFT
jgi:hypothetical protein